MSQYIISHNHPVSYEEEERWNTESLYYEYEPGNPNAPKGSHEYRGWGIQEELLPPKDAVEYVMANFKTSVAKVPLTDSGGYPTQLKPQFQWSILSAIMAHFLWYHEKDGVEYIAGIYNIEEVPPFLSGYSYFYTDPNTKSTNKIISQSEWKMRIWRTTDPEDKGDKEAPIKLPDESNMNEMQSLLGSVRDPYAHGENPVSGDDMYQWVSHQLHSWLISNVADLERPTRNHNRISGDQWIRSHERSPGIPFYSFIGNVELFGRKAFRMKDLHGNILWCGPSDMKAVPDRDLFLHEGRLSQDGIDNIFKCSCCGKSRNCLPLTGDQRLCAWCYGTTVERGERPTLKFCTRTECGGRSSSCPKYIPTGGELVALISSLNRGGQYPVHRETEREC